MVQVGLSTTFRVTLLLPEQSSQNQTLFTFYIDGLVQYRSNSSALAMELLQSCTNPSM